MSVTETPPESAAQALVERLFAASVGALELASVHIGNRLGFYRALGDGTSMTSRELAARTGTAERYVREWLEQQAVASILTVDATEAEPGERRYALSAAYRPVLVEPEDLSHLAPLASLTIGVLGPMQALIDAYRTGGGVPYEAYGTDTREGIAGMLDKDSAGTGTVIRSDTVRSYAREAGFTHVDVLPIENDFWRFYRLVP